MNPDSRTQTCALCPRLCRHVCPVAVATGREAATPTAIMTTLMRWTRGEVDPDIAGEAAALCTECGACEEACGVDQPVIDILQRAREALLAPVSVDPLQMVEGGATMVAIECDERSWAEALSGHLGRGVARLRTTDHLGVNRLDHPLSATDHLVAIRDRLGGRTAVVSCHSCARAAQAARNHTVHLQDLAPMPAEGKVHHPCHGPQLSEDRPANTPACCGASGPLRRIHPESAADLLTHAVRAIGPAAVCSPDTRCAQHLRTAGASVTDPVTHLLRQVAP